MKNTHIPTPVVVKLREHGTQHKKRDMIYDITFFCQQLYLHIYVDSKSIYPEKTSINTHAFFQL